MTKKHQIRKAVLPVGGLGTRFLPATKSMPKEMLTVVDKPLVQYAFEEAVEAGIDQFVFVTGRNKNTIANHFDHAYELQRTLSDKQKKEALEQVTGWLPQAGNIMFTRQQEPLGLGHAVWCARNWVNNEPFAVLLADDLMLSPKGMPAIGELCEIFAEKGGNVVAIEEVPMEETSKYGVLDIESDDGRMVRARGMVEKPAPEVAPSNLSVIGRYVLHPCIFDYLSRQQKGAGGEVQLTDAIAACLPDYPLHGVRTRARRYDCGSRMGWLEANIAFAMEREDMQERVLEMLSRFAEQAGGQVSHVKAVG